MKGKFVLLGILAFMFVSCASIPTGAGARTLYLDGTPVNEQDFGGTVSWYATEKYSDNFVDKVKLQVGYFKNNRIGFVLYDDGTDGVEARFSRDGLEYRWDWGLASDGSYNYAFVIKTDGTGLYYNFRGSSDGTAKPTGFYTMHVMTK